MKYQVHSAGKVEEFEASPEMERIFEEMKRFDKANPGFWCKCEVSEIGEIIPRGHSVDVTCAKCAGFTQVG